jgi:hypothetical protein
MPEDPTLPPTNPPEARCLQCGAAIDDPTEAVATEDGVFCARCFAALRSQLEQAVRAQSTDINYPVAALGGILGGAVGALIWWGFTVVTKISFGLVAVVIGLAVGHGVVRFAGKRSRSLQMLSVTIAAIAYFYGQFLVNRTLFLRYARENLPDGDAIAIPLLPNPDVFFEMVSAGFGLFDLIFLAIVVFEAWRIPGPIRLLRNG